MMTIQLTISVDKIQITPRPYLAQIKDISTKQNKDDKCFNFKSKCLYQ